jgi:sortase A
MMPIEPVPEPAEGVEETIGNTDGEEEAPTRSYEARRRGPARFFARASRALLWVGLLVVLFVGFELVGGALLHTEDQGRLLSRFKPLVASGGAAGMAWKPTPGQPIAQLIIPKIGVEEVVVQDTTPELLKGGPGHFLNTPLPGHPGNVVIAARRVTYGGVFRHLGQLGEGDHIALITPQGAFDYTVAGSPRIVGAGQPEVLASGPTPQLTLVTSDTMWTTRGRLIVTAALQGTPLEDVLPPVIALTKPQLGLTGDTGAVVIVIPWALALFAAWLGRAWLRRRIGSRRVAALIATPVILVILFFLFTSVDRLLPGTI